jgi:hypothetical protein
VPKAKFRLNLWNSASEVGGTYFLLSKVKYLPRAERKTVLNRQIIQPIDLVQSTAQDSMLVGSGQFIDKRKVKPIKSLCFSLDQS